MPDGKTKKLPAAEFLEQITNIASHFDLTDDQKAEYINEHMKRGGYKPTTTWGDAEESSDNGKNGGGWFPG